MPTRVAGADRLGRLIRRRPNAVAGTAVALLVVLAAFMGARATALRPTAALEILVVLSGAGAVVAAILRGPRGRVYGLVPAAALAALAALTTASILWSLAPGETWLEADLTFAYGFAFAGALALARMMPGAWRAVLAGLGVACLLVCAYAALTKIAPALLAENERVARLRAPYGYWNAVGLTGATGVLLALWGGTAAGARPRAAALAAPAIALCTLVLLLSFSRGSLLALAAGLVLWLVLAPRRLRSVWLLGVGGGTGGLLAAWAFGNDALTADRVVLAERTEAGVVLGILLVLALTTAYAGALVADFVQASRPLGPRRRVQIGRALLGALGAVPVLVLVVLAFSTGGVTGQVSDAWRSLTDPAAATPANTPDRLASTGSVRARYWREAISIWEDHPALGAGAGSFATARTRYREDFLSVRHAHGGIVQVLADLGLVGLAIVLAGIGGWIAAAVRTLRSRVADSPEWIGLVAMCAVVVTFGLHAAIDWTWAIPGTALLALIAAGWVAGRGPLTATPDAGVTEEHAATTTDAGRTPRHEPALVGAGAVPLDTGEVLVGEVVDHDGLPLAAHHTDAPPGRPPGRFARLGATDGPRDRERLLQAGVVGLLALTLSWVALQPSRSAAATDAASERLADGDLAQARALAARAEEIDPLSLEPLFVRSAIEDRAGDRRAAERVLERAVARHPASAEAWRRLGRYRFVRLDQASRAVEPLAAALYLDPFSERGTSDFLEARRAAREGS